MADGNSLRRHTQRKIHVELGNCAGNRADTAPRQLYARLRGDDDPHILFHILTEDDGNWGTSSGVFSTGWLTDLQDADEPGAEKWLEQNASKGRSWMVLSGGCRIINEVMAHADDYDGNRADEFAYGAVCMGIRDNVEMLKRYPYDTYRNKVDDLTRYLAPRSRFKRGVYQVGVQGVQVAGVPRLMTALEATLLLLMIGFMGSFPFMAGYCQGSVLVALQARKWKGNS